MASPEAEFKLGLARLSKNVDSSDFTITCGCLTFKVHKAILTSWSKYFETACQKGFKEANSNTIDLQTSDTDPTCDDPEAVKCMVHFFYHFDYGVDKVNGSAFVQSAVKSGASADTRSNTVCTTCGGSTNLLSDGWGTRCSCDDGWFAPRTPKAKKQRHLSRANQVQQLNGVSLVDMGPQVNSSDGNTLMHAKVFASAVKYQIPSLRRLAAGKFGQAVKTNAGHPDFAKAILVTYTTTPEDARELRDIVTDALHTRPDLLDSKEVEKVVRSISGLAWELFRKKSGKSAVVGGQQETAEDTTLCPSCSNPVFSDYCYNCSDA